MHFGSELKHDCHYIENVIISGFKIRSESVLVPLFIDRC
jgi:hypothetical protein